MAKKTTTTAAKTTPKVASVKIEKHDHKELEAQIVALRKELDAVSAELKALKSAPAPVVSDSRVDALLKNIANNLDYRGLRQLYKRNR